MRSQPPHYQVVSEIGYNRPVPKTNIVSRAVAIAKKSLLACYTADGVYAGLTHFREYWARDGLWTVLGILKVGDLSVAQKQINLFIRSMDKNGEVPMRIGSEFGSFWKLLGLPYLGKVRPLFNLNPAYFWFSGRDGRHLRGKDGGSLLAIASCEYLKHGGNHKQVEIWWPKLTRAMSWYEKHKTNHLVNEDWHEGWMDSLRLTGATLYTNILYLKAQTSMEKIAKTLGKNSLIWRRRYQETRSSLLKNFFNGSYLNNTGGGPRERQPFVVDGNMLAVWWKIVTPKSARLIIDHFLKSGVDHPVPCRVNTPKFHHSLIPQRFNLIGLSGYHNDDCAWLWIGAVSVLALKKHYSDKAKLLLEKIAKLIVKHDAVYEIYNSRGNPYNTWFYRSEHPFAWSSALFLTAASEWYSI